jgi:Zn-dependent alcohol dehydrogenase
MSSSSQTTPFPTLNLSATMKSLSTSWRCVFSFFFHPCPALSSHFPFFSPLFQAPINPSDINTIEGKYPLHPELPASPGHEGVGVVAAVGSRVTRLRPGDRCVPIEHSQGTWRTHGVFHETHWYRVPADLPIACAAAMVINPPTALRLLEEYVHLEPGDTVIQTGANSAVGKYVVQIAKAMGLNTINLIRDRANRCVPFFSTFYFVFSLISSIK